MTPLMIGAACLGLLFVLIALRFPIAWALALVGIIGHTALVSFEATLGQIGMIAWETGISFVLVAVPLYILMGQLIFHLGLSEDFFEAAFKWLGRLPGGLSVAAVGACAGFGAVTGSSLVAVTTMGGIVIPELKRYGYDQGLATGSLAAAGTLAILIPPSILMVLYGMWTETSIGALFMAGVVPGLALAFLYCGLIVVRCLLKPSLGPVGPTFSFKERVQAIGPAMPLVLLFAAILVGIYLGLVSVTEAAGIGVFVVLLLGFFRRRINGRTLINALRGTTILSGVIFAMLIGGTLMARFLVHTGIPESLAGLLTGASDNPVVILMMLIVVYLLLGAFLDTLGMLLITVPIFFPVILALGIDPVWFGIFLVLMTELALITPPIGLNVFVLKSVTPDVPIEKMFIGVLPFVLATLVLVMAIVLFPEIVLWLPSTMK